MKTRIYAILAIGLFAVSLSVGCTTESPGSGDEWDVGGGGDVSDDEDTMSADTADDGGEDAGTDDGGDQDVPDPDDAGPDADDGGENPVFEESSLEGTTWYGIFRLAQNEGITGTVFQVELMADNEVEIRAFGSVTGKWEIFGDRRLRVYDLARNGEPNEPEQFVFDVDLDDQDRTLGLELVIPREAAPPYTMRLEQLHNPDVTVADLDGDWQSEEVFPDDNDNDTRLAMRFFGDRIGYGAYNGAYIEFVSGMAQTLTLDTGETFWMLLPPPDGAQQATFGGEIQTDEDGTITVFAPRQTNPGEEPAEFTSEPMISVSSFSL